MKQNFRIKIKPIFGIGFWFDDWNIGDDNGRTYNLIILCLHVQFGKLIWIKQLN